MKNVSLIVLALCLLGCTYADRLPESKSPVKVFLLAGQSNMEGQGVVSMDLSLIHISEPTRPY